MDTPSIPLKCTHCDGQGLVVRKVFSKLYRCGYKTEATVCTHCRFGFVPVLETQMAAAGEVA
jgi:hypothetical protein